MLTLASYGFGGAATMCGRQGMGRLTSDHRAYSSKGFLAIGVVLAFFGGFASRAPLDSAAIAPGRVATNRARSLSSISRGVSCARSS